MIDIITESLRTIVSSGKGGKGDLISALKQLDDILEANGAVLDARLRHFLQNRSYETKTSGSKPVYTCFCINWTLTI